MDSLRVSLDSATLDGSGNKRKLQAIEQDGTLTYEQRQAPDAKLTETLGRIWNEYPGGMLDISEDVLESRDPEEPAVEPVKAKEEQEKAPGSMMSFEEMSRLRETILGQLNHSRNELWYVLELAKTLSLSTSHTATPPPPPSLLPPPKKPNKAKPPAKEDIKPLQATEDPLILPPGTFSTVPANPPSKPLITEVLELETALAAKQAALDQCVTMIDTAVDELTNMNAASEAFWNDVRALKDGSKGRGQWAVVPKPDFGRVADGQKAKDVIIPYAIDEASPAMRARCLAAFDLDPKKKELAFGARTFLSLRLTIIDANGTLLSSTVPERLSSDASVGARMEEAQMEAFDEDLFRELSAEISRHPTGSVEPRSISFDIEDETICFELVDARQPPPSSTHCTMSDVLLASTRHSFIRVLQIRKQRLISRSSITKHESIIIPIAQLHQQRILAAKVGDALHVLCRTLQSAGVEARVTVRPSLDKRDKVVKVLEGKVPTESVGTIYTLALKGCTGILVQASAPNSLLVSTQWATYPLYDPADMVPIVADTISQQLLRCVLDELHKQPGSQGVFIDELEESISIPDRGSLRLSIPAPYDAIHVRMDGHKDGYDSRSGQGLFEWVHNVPGT